jgi:predicted dehydrogenase
MPMKILVIGCGSIGTRHTRNLRDLGVADLLVFDPDQERATQLARESRAFPVDRLEHAYDRHPEAVLICAPTSLHLSLARQALEHDCHIFLEKPLSHTMAGVIEFVSEAKARHRIVLVGYNLRFDPLLHQLHAWLKESRIGHVASARLHVGSYLPWRHPWEDYRVGYGARKSLGGGVILDASHELDYALWLFGHPKGVYCAGGKHSSLEIDVEDVAEILMSYEHAVVSIHLDYIAQSSQRTCDVIGSHGQIHADLIARRLALFNASTREWDAPQVYCPFDELYRIEMQHFLDCIAGKAAPAVDGSAGLESLLLADSAKRSIISGDPVAFDRPVSGADEPAQLRVASPPTAYA